MGWLGLLIANEGFEGYYIFSDMPEANAIIMALSLLIGCFCFFFVLPAVNVKYMMCTSIQMMKKRPLIERVIQQQRT